MSTTLLIRNAEIDPDHVVDVLIEGGRIGVMGPAAAERGGAREIDAQGGALLPALTDHHLHLNALAAARTSLLCGPPAVGSADELAAALANASGSGWLRGIAYDESVAGDLDRQWLDRHCDRPVRIAHRGGRLWMLNSAALAELGEEAQQKFPDGRLLDSDDWLRRQLDSEWPDLAALSQQLAGFGITSITDTTPHNDSETLRRLSEACARGELLQNVLLMGDSSLNGCRGSGRVAIGPLKLHLLESALPSLDACAEQILLARRSRRRVAIHCVTRAELVFALAVLEQTEARPGDRIEHASVTPPELLDQLRALGLIVVTQPALVAERGDRYLAEVDADDQPWLYRLRGFADAGVLLAGSSDAPYTDPDPWRAMQAAVLRRTASGAVLGEDEALTPEQALDLYLSAASSPGLPRRIDPGCRADLCLLSESWNLVRERLDEACVRLTLRDGEPIYERELADLS